MRKSATSEKFDLDRFIADKVATAIEEGWTWNMPWLASGGNGSFTNPKTGTRYRGINVWLLAIAQFTAGYADCRWVTFKQAQELAGKGKDAKTAAPKILKDDQRATLITFWKRVDGKEKTAADGSVSKDQPFAFMRYYNVFNVEQTNLVELGALPALGTVPDTGMADRIDQYTAAQAIVDGYTGRPTIKEGMGEAAYFPMSDTIGIPEKNSFTSPEAWFKTLYHELAHSTGSEKRLNRSSIVKSPGKFGTEAYGTEELIAELAAVLLAHDAGLTNAKETDQSAAYIGGWAKKIRAEPTLIVRAAGQAQKAAEYILGTVPPAQEEEEK